MPLIILAALFGCVKTQKILATDRFINIVARKSTVNIFSNIYLLEVYAAKLGKSHISFSDTCQSKLQKIANDSITELKIFGFSRKVMPVKNTRDKRGIRPLGTLLSWLTDTPSPDSWDREIELTQKLKSIITDEGAEILSIEHVLEREDKYLQALKSKMAILLNAEQTNSILVTNFSSELNAYNNAESVCIFGESIAHTILREMNIVKSIFTDSRQNLPNVYLFPPYNLKKLLEQKSIFTKGSDHLEYYHMNSAITTIHKYEIISIFSIPIIDASQTNSFTVHNFIKNNQARISPLEQIAQKTIDTMVCLKNTRQSILLSSLSLIHI